VVRVARVLVVDDDPVIRRLIEVNLDLEGYEVLQAGDGHAALDLMHAEDVDLVVLDVMMPNLNGWEVREQMLQDQRLEDVPVIFLSARAQDADMQRGSEMRATAYVTKPFDPVEFLDLVAEILEVSGPPDH
jgi:DNA-binding response OmpR family regulator